MLTIFNYIRHTIEGSLLAIVLVVLVAVFGWSPTIETLVEDASVSSILFLVVLVILLTDMIAKLIDILARTFPDLLPKVEERDLRMAAFVDRLAPQEAIGLLAGAHIARILVFLLVFALLGASYANAPNAVQAQLVGDYGVWAATEAFLRESAAGSVGYFLFFLGPDKLQPITDAIAAERLQSNSLDGDVFLSGLRLYGLPFVFAVLRAIVTPVIFVRARLRSRKLNVPA
jgi:hypothetical protein